MVPNIAELSRFQISNFFQPPNTSVTQEECDGKALDITGQTSVTPTASQGGSSYTVEGGKLVVQFRVESSVLDMDFVQNIEQTYAGFTPHHTYKGQLGDLHVYAMNNIGGTCMYLARDELYANDYALLQITIDDYARLFRFFASAYRNTPDTMKRSEPKLLQEKYSSQLQQLREGLPERFHAKLDELIPQVPDLFAEGWPLVPNHTDLLENNIHVDTATGKIVGICDWRDAEVSPFGMSFDGLETMLGTRRIKEWTYHPNHQELRDLFWKTLYNHLGGEVSDVQKRRMEAATQISLFLHNAFEYDGRVTQDDYELGFLGQAVLGREIFLARCL